MDHFINLSELFVEQLIYVVFAYIPVSTTSKEVAFINCNFINWITIGTR